MEKKQLNIPTGTILSAGVVLAAFLAGRKLLQSFGILKTAKDIENAEKADKASQGSTTQVDTVPANASPGLALNVRYVWAIIKDAAAKKKVPSWPWDAATINKYFNPYGSSSTVQYTTVLSNLAKQVYDAKGVFYDNENSAFAAFQACRNQAQISLMSGFFLKDFKRDMWAYCQSFMNEAQQAKVLDIIAGKPLL